MKRIFNILAFILLLIGCRQKSTSLTLKQLSDLKWDSLDKGISYHSTLTLEKPQINSTFRHFYQGAEYLDGTFYNRPEERGDVSIPVHILKDNQLLFSSEGYLRVDLKKKNKRDTIKLFISLFNDTYYKKNDFFKADSTFIKSIAGVASVKYLSKEEEVRLWLEEIGESEEDFDESGRPHFHILAVMDQREWVESALSSIEYTVRKNVKNAAMVIYPFLFFEDSTIKYHYYWYQRNPIKDSYRQ